jgi:uncharacterized membrane protein
MDTAVNLWPLIGVVVIIAGFILRFNPMLVVAVAAIATGFAASMPIDKILTAIGTGIIKTRTLPLIILLPLAVVGLLERHGLREHAQNWISRIQSATVGRLLIVYLAVRELTAAAGLTSLGGHPQMVRPLLAPMAEGAAENRFGKLPEPVREKLLAFCAATDNVGCRQDESRRRSRRHRADAHLPARLGHRRGAAEDCRVGYSDRDLRVPDPLGAPQAPGRLAGPRDGRCRQHQCRHGQAGVSHDFVDQLSVLAGRDHPDDHRADDLCRFAPPAPLDHGPVLGDLRRDLPGR